MNITVWNLTVIATFFTAQYDYTVTKEPLSPLYISTDNDTLVTCIHLGDKPFKESSPTSPRAELRSKLEVSGGDEYSFGVEVLSTPNGTDFSVWQVFAGGKPFLMIRHRKGSVEMVAFKGKPKIQQMDSFPSSCVLKCGRRGSLMCGEYISYGRFKCKDMYFRPVPCLL